MRGLPAFLSQQGKFSWKAAGVAAEGAIGANDAVAGNSGGVRVAVQGVTDGAGQSGIAEPGGDPTVGADFAFRDATDDGVDPLLE